MILSVAPAVKSWLTCRAAAENLLGLASASSLHGGRRGLGDLGRRDLLASIGGRIDESGVLLPILDWVLDPLGCGSLAIRHRTVFHLPAVAGRHSDTGALPGRGISGREAPRCWQVSEVWIRSASSLLMFV